MTGFNLGILSAAIVVAQIQNNTTPYRWISPLIIMFCLLSCSLFLAVAENANQLFGEGIPDEEKRAESKIEAVEDCNSTSTATERSR